MLNAASPGTLGFIGDLVNNLPPVTQGVSSWWAGEHILELGQIHYFFFDYLQSQSSALVAHAPGIDWNAIWTTISTCEGPKAAMETVLNSKFNLIGLSSEVNGLKAIFFRFARASPTTWDALTAQALQQYLSLVQNNYDHVSQSVGNILNMAAGGQWYQQRWDMQGSPGSFFVAYATYVFNQALKGVAPLAKAKPGPRYSTFQLGGCGETC